jgi:hypothetical protein
VKELMPSSSDPIHLNCYGRTLPPGAEVTQTKATWYSVSEKEWKVNNFDKFFQRAKNKLKNCGPILPGQDAVH